MAATILVTKLFIPQARPELVSRPRLIEQLNAGIYRKLTLISAPAGFGKTTVVTEWINKLRGNTQHQNSRKTKFAWISLDKGDNDPTRFLTYLVAALKQIDGQDSLEEGALALLQSTQQSPTKAILTPLINDLAGIANKIVLVFDDYHLIDNQPVHDVITFFIENQPPSLHLVIITREDPLLPLSRLRVREQLTELRATDLRFTESEASEFLNQTMGLNLSPENVTALENRTEGWIAGLQLAAISLQGQADTTRLVQTFTGSNRLVLDYLIDEVLQQQSPSTKDFLLNTSILRRMCGSLCDAVRFGSEKPNQGQEKGQAILEKLERVNLFVVPLDGERQWYRYHHLFADLLRQRLHQTAPEKKPILHSRASDWYERNILQDEAIEHAFLAGDFKRSADLIADIADELWKRGEHVKLRLWLAKLPENSLCAQPQLCIYHFWFLFSTGQQESTQRFLQAIEDTFETIPDQDSGKTRLLESEQLKLQGRLGAIRSLICTWKEDWPGIIRHAGIAQKYLPIGDPWRRLAAMSLGDAQYYQGHVQAAYQTRLEIQAACRPEDDLFFSMIANLKVATSLREMGKLNETIEICQQQLEFAKEHSLLKTIFVGWALTLWAVALAEQNKLDQALEYAIQSLALTEGGDLAFLCFSYIVLAKVHFYRGDYANAEANLQKLAEIKRTNAIPFYTAGSMAGWQARIMLAQNQMEFAAQWISAQDCEGDLTKLIVYDHVIVVRARLLLAQGNLDEAATLLQRLREACEVMEHTARLIEILVLQALTQHAAGELKLAHETLARALILAESGGYIRVFVDEGPPMARLLYEALSHGVTPNYIQTLLAAFEQTEPKKITPPQTLSTDGDWIEPLTQRELDVLELIAAGLTNREVASKLYLSLNTVKVHTRNIYGKLGVTNRTQAGSKARTLGILITS